MDISFRSILRRGSIIKIPTITRAGAVAIDGTIKNTGEKNSARRNSTPVTQAVIPVRPPSAIPVVLSAP